MKGYKKIILTFLCAAVLALLTCVAACGETPPEPPVPFSPPLFYEDFGAVGDGIADDFDAIKRTHEQANKTGRPVSCDDGSTFYIGAHRDTIAVKTDTDWGKAHFIIDDSNVSVDDRSFHVFEIKSDTSSYKVKVPSSLKLKKGDKNIGVTLDAPALIQIVNSEKKDYIRYGKNTNSGSSRQEILLVDADGNIDPTTPLLWDYDKVTDMTAYSVTDKAITVSGGIFTTIANTVPVSTNYYARGISVRRSNTTVSNVAHYVTGEGKAEGKSCSPYTGFYVVTAANNVTFEECVLTGRTVYTNIKPTGAVQQGTYDTQAVRSNAVSWVNCTQSNDITDTKFWGVMASNFCKNLNMTGCKLSRFDAHQGVYNATISDTDLGHNLTIIGAGTLTLTNVPRLAGSHFLQLRTDYGSTWEGEIVLKDCTLAAPTGNCHIIQAQWNDWDFGYTCYLPEKVTVDNFKAEGASKCSVFSSVTNRSKAEIAVSTNPYVVTKEIAVRNEATPLSVSENNSGLFEGTHITRE